MVERYHSQVQQGSLPNAYMRNYVDGAATGVQVAGAVRQGGEEIRKYAMVQQRRQDEWDATRVMEAQTEYNRVMSDRMDNPEDGFTNTRKLGAARGVTDAIDKYGDETAGRIAGTLDNDAQRQAFLRVAQRAKIPYWKQASEFEARQVKTYRDQVFKTTLDQGGMSVQRAPLDNVTFTAAAEQGANAIRSQFYGADESVVNAAVEEYTSGLEQQRIAIVAAEDPILANRMIEGSQYLTPEAASKLKSSIAPQVELLENQEFVDGFVQEYGPDREQEGIAKIRETSSGRDEEKKVSAYRARINEMMVGEGNADAELRKMQNQNFETYKADYYRNGSIPPQAKLDSDLNNKNIDADQYRTMTSWNEVAATRSDITRNFAKNDPNWNNMTAEEQESRVMRAAGKTPEQRATVLERIKSGILDGSVTDADLDTEYNNMNITRAERDYYKAMDTKFGKEQKDFVAQQKRDLITDIATINIPGKNGSMYRSIAQSVFTDRVAQLDPQSKSYRMDVMDARRAAVVAAVEVSGKSLETSGGFLWMNTVPSKFGQRVSTALTSLEEATGNVEEYRPEMYESKVDLTPREGETAPFRKQPVRLSGGAVPPAQELSPKMQGNKATFVNEVLPDIMTVSQDVGVLPSVMAAQAILESNWGKSRVGNNLFGVKAGKSWTGKTRNATTHEESGGKMYKTNAPFRDYDSAGESIADLGSLLSRDRYTPVRRAENYVDAAKALQKSGYATDSKYADKLINVIRTYGLDKLDGQAQDETNQSQIGPTRDNAAALQAQPQKTPEQIADSILFGGAEAM